MEMVPPLTSPLTSPHPSQAAQAFLGFQKYKLGADSALFSQEYADPGQDPNSVPSGASEFMEAPVNTEPAYDGSAGYQGQEY